MSKKHGWNVEELTCKPLDTYAEILLFLENPPPWRTLCKELTPHSKSMLKNRLINNNMDTFLDTPETFCHFDPDAEEVIRQDEDTLPKTLVCHDMANGYHDDSYIDGTANHDAYTFYNWAGIDIFCYFSHHLVTIPPLGWINVGHAHGVKVIGTLISEWAEGILFWDRILSSEQEYQNFASTLVAITKTLKFDGWLLNVENKISKPMELVEFVKYLNRILHQEIPHAVLIWYDSVTINGSLNWQNGLNDKNRLFFDACDGIFTNYSWNASDVEESARAAGARLTDVYVGIDVWGRNFFGGGQFNTQEAVKVVYDRGCSLAIFAPAWTHEAMSGDNCDVNAVAMGKGLDNWQQFMVRDRALWGSLWPFLHTRVPAALPFQTSFCRGQGRRRRALGEVLCNTPWYNLRHQQYQPNSAHGPHGYLLSTIDAILSHSRHTYKDGKGILRYRDSFEMSRMELHSTKYKESSTVLHSAKVRESSVVPKADSLVNVEEEEEEEPEPEAPKPPKRKMKNYLKSLLQLKSPRKDSTDGVEVPHEPETSNLESEPSSTGQGGRGKSMLQMSVSLKLGQKGNQQRFGLACVPEERECLEVYQDDSFNGGSCLRINPTDSLSQEHRLSRLFHCDFYCEHTLIICVVTKKLAGFIQQCLNIKLFMKNVEGENLRVMLIGRNLPQLHQVSASSTGSCNVSPLETSSERFKRMQRYLLLNQSGFYVPVENSFDWKVRYYEINLPGTRITSINCRTYLEQGPILLGHLGICHRPAEDQDS